MARAPTGREVVQLEQQQLSSESQATLGFLAERFASWYRQNPVPAPTRLQRREFGYMLWPNKPGPPPFIRHRAYGSLEVFREDVAALVPHSIYSSTAYYRKPWELKMLEKGWMGAELIFDLDADHLAEVEAAAHAGNPLGLEDQLRLVKRSFHRLLDDFVFGDFGFTRSDVTLAFSGGRGYHAHITQEAIMQLGSRERRELVDYVTGKVPTVPGTKEPDLSLFLREETIRVERVGRHERRTTALRMAPASMPGWGGRMTRTLVQTLQQEVMDVDEPTACRWLSRIDGIGDVGAQRFKQTLTPERLDRIGRGHIEQGPVVKRVLQHLLRKAILPLARGEADEPVTADIKRLIRLPGSLHGGTGLRCLSLTEEQLDDFDPLQDATAFGDEPVRIRGKRDATIRLAGQATAIKANETCEVPATHAVFFLARRDAVLETA